MPGGSEEAWPFVKDILQSIAAKVADGTPCCDWVGADGAGHYVKMVHNGIEYGDMQVIAEAYALMKATGMSHEDMAETFRAWGEGVLDSFLVDITADILAFRDEAGEIVGPVRSGTLSPSLGCGIGTVYLPADARPGDEVSIRIRDRDIPGEVVPLPFYDGGSLKR